MPRLLRECEYSSSSSSATWTVRLYADGSRSCNCPGWTKRAVRDCKHVNRVRLERKAVVAGEVVAFWTDSLVTCTCAARLGTYGTRCRHVQEAMAPQPPPRRAPEVVPMRVTREEPGLPPMWPAPEPAKASPPPPKQPDVARRRLNFRKEST